MIIRESNDAFTFITQHDHANLAGEFLMNLKREFVPLDHYESLKFAVYQHDRGWLVADSTPIWNDKANRPYDFVDYPELLKIYFYKLGIDQVDQANSYSALLCSMHYASFFENSETEAGVNFYKRELQRQKHLMRKLKINNDTFVRYQLQLLQLCDELSLYICLNTPGASKGEEHPFFRKGFTDSEFFNVKSDRKLTASFLNAHNIGFNSSPLEKRVELKFPIKKVYKKDIAKIGLQEAYHQQPFFITSIKVG